MQKKKNIPQIIVFHLEAICFLRAWRKDSQIDDSIVYLMQRHSPTDDFFSSNYKNGFKFKDPEHVVV